MTKAKSVPARPVQFKVVLDGVSSLEVFADIKAFDERIEALKKLGTQGTRVDVFTSDGALYAHYGPKLPWETFLPQVVDRFLRSNYESLKAEFLKRFEKSPTYAIAWGGYSLMRAQAEEAHYVKIKSWLLVEGIPVENAKAMIRESKKRLLDLVMKEWVIEWDRSTAALANQEEKAKGVAMVETYERLRMVEEEIARWEKQA